MSDIVSFVCPSCGGRKFKLSVEPKSYKDFVGAACVGCGTMLTDEEIKRQAVEVARQAFKKKL